MPVPAPSWLVEATEDKKRYIVTMLSFQNLNIKPAHNKQTQPILSEILKQQFTLTLT